MKTCSLPKLNLTREWGLGDKQLEERVDRYGNVFSRECGSSALMSMSKDHNRGESRRHSFPHQSPLRSDSGTFTRQRFLGFVKSEVSGTALLPGCDDISPRKRPRLTWGQGLAKYEKAKSEEEPTASKGHMGYGPYSADKLFSDSLLEPPFDGESGLSCHQSHQESNSITDSIKTCFESRHLEPSTCVTSLETSIKETRSLYECKGSPGKDDICSEITTVTMLDDSSRETCNAPPTILEEVQASLLSYEKSGEYLSKDVLSCQMARLEHEIEWIEKKLVQIGDGCIVEVLPCMKGAAQAIFHQALGEPVAEGKKEDLKKGPGGEDELEDGLGILRMREYDVESDACDNQQAIEVLEEKQGHDFEAGALTSCKSSMNAATQKIDDVSYFHLSNEKLAEQSSSMLSHLLSTHEASAAFEFFHNDSQDARVWNSNMEHHEKSMKVLELKVGEKNSLRIREMVLSLKQRALTDALRSQHESADQQFESILHGQQPLVGVHRAVGSKYSDIDNQTLRKLLFKQERMHLRMPSMLLGEEGRLIHGFMSQNGLVEDPVAFERERKLTNPWSEEERATFLEKYSLFGKDFGKICSFLRHKTVADCVEFYYRNRKSEEFRGRHPKRQAKKQGDYLVCRRFYTGTTSNLCYGRCQEENEACMDGLSLVAAAAAAAALSSPRCYDVSSWHACNNAAKEAGSRCDEDIALLKIHDERETAAALVDLSLATPAEEGLQCEESVQFKSNLGSPSMESSAEHDHPHWKFAACEAAIVLSLPEMQHRFANIEPSVPGVSPPLRRGKLGASSETKTRRERTSWTAGEKEAFMDIIMNYGKDWDRLCQSLPTKSLTQIKTYLQNLKAKQHFTIPEGAIGAGNSRCVSRKAKVEDSGSSNNNSAAGVQKPVPDVVSLNSSLHSPFLAKIENGTPGAEGHAHATLLSRNTCQDAKDPSWQQSHMQNACQEQSNSVTILQSSREDTLQRQQNLVCHLQQQVAVLQQLLAQRHQHEQLLLASQHALQQSSQFVQQLSSLGLAPDALPEAFVDPIVVLQASQTSTKSQDIAPLLAHASDVKLFGQSLLLSPSCAQQTIGSVSCPQDMPSVVSSSMVVTEASVDALV